MNFDFKKGVMVMSKVVFLKESKIEKTHKYEHESYEYYKKEITKRSEFDQMYASFYEIPPQKSAYPLHFHENVTELFYIISGSGFVQTKEKEIFIETGDVLVFPPGEVGLHKLTNISELLPLVYLDVATRSAIDILHYPDSNKIGIIKHNEFAKFYKKDDNVDYYQDEWWKLVRMIKGD